MTDDATRSVAVEQFIARANALAEQRIPPLYKQLLKDSSETFAKKWLVARNFVVDDAFAMFSAACEFRLERALDSLSLFPSATALQGYDVEKLVAFTGKPPRTRPSELDTIVRNVKTCVTRCWHKFDKVGASFHCCTRPQPQLLRLRITSSISPSAPTPVPGWPPRLHRTHRMHPKQKTMHSNQEPRHPRRTHPFVYRPSSQRGSWTSARSFQ